MRAKALSEQTKKAQLQMEVRMNKVVKKIGKMPMTRSEKPK